MESIVFVIALVGVLYVVFWAIRNDSAGDDKPTKGFLRMLDDEDQHKASNDSP